MVTAQNEPAASNSAAWKGSPGPKAQRALVIVVVAGVLCASAAALAIVVASSTGGLTPAVPVKGHLLPRPDATGRGRSSAAQASGALARSTLAAAASRPQARDVAGSSARYHAFAGCAQRAWQSHWSAGEGRLVERCAGRPAAWQCPRERRGEEDRRKPDGPWVEALEDEPPWFCRGTSVAVNYAAVHFGDIDYNVATWSNTYRFPKGFINVACPAARDGEGRNATAGKDAATPCLLTDYGDLHPTAPLKHHAPSCSVTAVRELDRCHTRVSHQTALLSRSSVKNWYHHFFNALDLFHMLVAADALDTLQEIVLLPPDKAHIGSWGNQLDILRMMANGGPVRTAENITSTLAEADVGRVCYDDVLFLVNGQSGMVLLEDTSSYSFARVTQAAGCVADARLDSLVASTTHPSMRLFTDRMLRFYGLPSSAMRRRPTVLNVVVISRGAGQGGQYHAAVTHRRILNEAEVVKALEGPAVHVTVVDFQLLSFKEQVALLSDTDILLGAHGAGLTNLVFLPPRSAVVEVFPSQDGMLMMYQALATRAGMRYSMLFGQDADATSSFTLKAEAVVAEVRGISSTLHREE